MTAAASQYATAGLRYLGEREAEEHGRFTNRQRFGKRFRWDGVPWCMIFAWCVADDVKIGHLVPRTASCRTAAAWFRRRGQWHPRTHRPHVGDLIFFGKPRAPHHVGIVTHFDLVAHSVTYVSGNSNDGRAPAGTGDAVTLKAVALDSPTIAGYGRPAWPAEPVDVWPSNDLGKVEPQDHRTRDAARTWIVGRKGATLTGLAAALGISASLLLSANPDADHLSPGARVTIPAPGPTPGLPASTPPADRAPHATGRGPFVLRCTPGKAGVWRCTVTKGTS